MYPEGFEPPIPAFGWPRDYEPRALTRLSYGYLYPYLTVKLGTALPNHPAGSIQPAQLSKPFQTACPLRSELLDHS